MPHDTTKGRVSPRGATVALTALFVAAASAEVEAPETPNQPVGPAATEQAREPRHGAVPDGMVLRHGDILVPKKWLDTMAFSGLDWPNGYVPIVFDASLTNVEVNTYLQAMDIWNLSGASVSFIYRTNESDYVRIQGSTANNSNVGMIGGQQTINVNEPPTYSAAHELCHTLGFFHEQSRADRDTYVQIETANIQAGQEHNFDIELSATSFTGYDFDSVMHYSECGFSCCNDPNAPCGASSCSGQSSCRTITVLPPYEGWQSLIGQRDHLSTNDVLDMQNVYGSGRIQVYVDPAANMFGQGTMFSPNGNPLFVSHAVDGTVWLRGGGYSNTVSAGRYNSAATLRAHGGDATLGAGPP